MNKNEPSLTIETTFPDPNLKESKSLTSGCTLREGLLFWTVILTGARAFGPHTMRLLRIYLVLKKMLGPSAVSGPWPSHGRVLQTPVNWKNGKVVINESMTRPPGPLWCSGLCLRIVASYLDLYVLKSVEISLGEI